MGINNEQILELVHELQAQITSKKYIVTLLPGSALLLRDIATNKIRLIDEGTNPDEYAQYEPAGMFKHIIDIWCLYSWNEIKNDPEAIWLLEHMNPGLTAKQSWTKEVKTYSDWKNDASGERAKAQKEMESSIKKIEMANAKERKSNKPKEKPIEPILHVETEAEYVQRIQGLARSLEYDFERLGR